MQGCYRGERDPEERYRIALEFGELVRYLHGARPPIWLDWQVGYLPPIRRFDRILKQSASHE